jgi:hypothetical protein
MPAPLPVPPASPQAVIGSKMAPPPLPPAEQSPGSKPWVRLLPAAVLGIALVGMFGRDLTVREDSGDDEPEAVIPEPKIDKAPSVDLVLNPGTMQFALRTVKETDSTGQPKKLIFMNREGERLFLTSLAGARIDGKTYRPGVWWLVHGSGEKGGDIKRSDETQIPFPGRAVGTAQTLEPDASGQHGGQRMAWQWDKSRVTLTQTVEIVAGQPDPASDMRLLDTCLVTFTLKNDDDHAHRVGFRFILDTFIGTNDGVPFYIPRPKDPLCNTMADFRGVDIPDYVQALEYPALDKPGTVAQVSLKVGGDLEAPSRVALTHYAQPRLNVVGKDEVVEDHDIPQADIQGNLFSLDADQRKKDSAVVLYWDEKELEPGKTRKLGFSYGLGHISSSTGGKLGVTPPTNLEAGKDFPVTALVSEPVAGQSVELILHSKKLTLVEGTLKQTVPPLPADAVSRNSSVTWRVKTDKGGTYKLTVRSSTGETRTIKVVVAARDIILK